MNRWILLLLGLGGPLLAGAQTSAPFGFVYQPELAKVMHGTETLAAPWAGGLNSPQFSAIDLNGDQQPDLYLFDRFTSRSLTFLNVAAPGGGRTYQYAPEYEALFPKGLVNWVLLRDYDCDGRPDLFCFAGGSNIAVYRNVADANGRPTFQLASGQLDAYVNAVSGSINIITGGYNIPAIHDVDGDGRLDIVTFDANDPPLARYYQNTSSACGGLSFRLAEQRWGDFSACAISCTGFAYGNSVYCRPAGTQHTGGYSVTLLDLDGDGDQDALIGRDYCAEVVSLRNDGTPTAARMTSAGQNNSFPTGTTPIRIANFPAAYHLDVTFDGKPDLVVSPSVIDNQDTINTAQTVALYANTSASAVPVFTYRQPDFLQGGMIDVGDRAAPTFADLDGDGLLDMLVGSTNRNGPKGFYRASLTYYRNVGTAAQPVFRHVTNDYLGLAAQKYASIRPVLTDLNQDGRPDLVLAIVPQSDDYLTRTSSQLRVLLNTAATGQAAFNLATAQVLQNLPNYAEDAPCFADVDGDGLPDLLLGTNSSDQTGPGLRYYRNNGTQPISQAFTLANADYGQLRGLATNRVGNIHPAVADFNADGLPDLLVADALGRVRLFSNFRAQQGAFVAQPEAFYNELLSSYQPVQLGQGAGNHLAPAVADLNGDQRPELFIGLESGGIVSYAARGTVLSTAPTTPVATVPGLQLYPNPATGTATVEAAEVVHVTLLDLTGRLLYRTPTAARTQVLTVQGLAAGVYVVQVETNAGQRTARRLVVR